MLSILRPRWFLVVALAASVALLPWLTVGQRQVVLPLAAQILIALFFLSAITPRGRPLPLEEIGTWYVAAITIYGVLPLVVFLGLGLQFAAFNDARLYSFDPTPWEVGQVAWYYAIYQASFVAAYLAWRPRQVVRTRLAAVEFRLALVASVLLLGAWTFFVLLGRFYDLSTETYAETYLVFQQLPLGIRQVAKLVKGFELILNLILITWIFSDFRHRRWLLLLWLAYVIGTSVARAGARTELVLLLLAAAISYHVRVRPIRAWVALLGGTVGLVGFLSLGLYRSVQSLDDPNRFTFGVSAGEFEALFANALDLRQRKLDGEIKKLPSTFYLSDLVAVVPSQVLPFRKVDPSEWYLETFYPEVQARGEGFVFGVIAQSLVGLGGLELMIRGLVVGSLFAGIFARYVRNRDCWWMVVAYLWLILLAYESFRVSTFFVLSDFVQHLIPCLFLVALGAELLTAWSRARVARGVVKEAPSTP